MNSTHSNTKTIIEAAEEDLKVETEKSEESGKFAAKLSLIKNGINLKMLLETDPVFATPKEAENCMRDSIQIIRKSSRKALRNVR
jgi:ApbE superfamily uncharacterized protein (UPF0280 family)